MRVCIKKTLRDIRDIRFQFLSLIIILSLGAGMFYGVSLTTSYREASLNESYERLKWEDIQIDLIPDSYYSSSEILTMINNNEYISQIESFELRLVLTAAVNISTEDQFLIIPGEIIGTNITFNRPSSNTNMPEVNNIKIESGRYFETYEQNELISIAEKRLFKHHDISLGDSISLLSPKGSTEIELIGSATFPDFMMLVDDNSMGLFSEKLFTVLQLPLVVTQNLFSLEGKVNQILIRVTDDSKIPEIKHSLGINLADFGINTIISAGTDHPVYKLQYDDLKNDNEFFQTIAILFLFGGLFGTYVTINRLTASQRREIGISLALGFKPRSIVTQYLIVGFLISILSIICTYIFGMVISNAFWSLSKEMIGVPFFVEDQNPVYFLQACILIFAIPILTIILTALQLSRNIPVQLIRFDPRTAHKTSSKTILEKTLFRIITLSISKKISIRNLLRNKKRTMSTAFGVLISIVLMGAMWGLVDTFDSGIHTAKVDHGTWDIKFDGKEFSPAVLWENNLESTPSHNFIESYILTFQTVVRFPGYFEPDGADYYRLLEGLPNIDIVRTINLMEGTFTEQGIVISQKMANQLNKDIGDNVTLEHLMIGGPYGIQLTNSSIKITGIHNQIFASFCYTPLNTVQTLCNATSLVNGGYIVLNDISNEQSVTEDLYTHLFNIYRVTSRKAIIEETMTIFDLFYSIVLIAQGLCMILALGLIYSSIFSNIHERKREIGTLRTLGTSSRAIIRYIFIENAIMVSIGLILGYIFGFALIDLILQRIMSETFPHLFVPTVLTFNSWLIIVVSIFLILLVAQLTVVTFLRNLDLVGATKVRE